MENPVFKLEKVVRSRSEEMQDFEGPLDLILFLLSKNKMEIQDISISLICDQYVAWLESRQKMDLEVASEFVTMASHLVYIKTRMLLSIEDEEAQSEMDALIQSLEERRRNESYARVKMLSERLGPMAEFGRNIFTRSQEPMEAGKVYEYDVFGKHLKYSRFANMIGKGIRSYGDLKAVQFYGISDTEMVSYVKITGVELFLPDIHRTIVEDNLEIELYAP